jgi:hypothetical protein
VDYDVKVIRKFSGFVKKYYSVVMKFRFCEKDGKEPFA